MLSLLPCPEPGCGAVAELQDWVIAWSTDGPVRHVKVLCVRRHIFLMPAAHVEACDDDRDTGARAVCDTTPSIAPLGVPATIVSHLPGCSAG